MPSFYFNNWFATNNENNNKENNIVTIIKELFLNIMYRLLSKKLIKKYI